MEIGAFPGVIQFKAVMELESAVCAETQRAHEIPYDVVVESELSEETDRYGTLATVARQQGLVRTDETVTLRARSLFTVTMPLSMTWPSMA